MRKFLRISGNQSLRAGRNRHDGEAFETDFLQMGLVITREPGQTIVVDGPAVITFVNQGKKCRVLIDAPKTTKILRGELINEQKPG